MNNLEGFLHKHCTVQNDPQKYFNTLEYLEKNYAKYNSMPNKQIYQSKKFQKEQNYFKYQGQK